MSTLICSSYLPKDRQAQKGKKRDIFFVRGRKPRNFDRHTSSSNFRRRLFSKRGLDSISDTQEKINHSFNRLFYEYACCFLPAETARRFISGSLKNAIPNFPFFLLPLPFPIVPSFVYLKSALLFVQDDYGRRSKLVLSVNTGRIDQRESSKKSIGS